MNEATKAEVIAAVAKWRPRLRLMDWTIAYEWHDANVHVVRCFTEERYRRAKLHFAPDFPHLDKDDVPNEWLTVEKMVVHELCHIVLSLLHVAGRTVVGEAQIGKVGEDQAFDRLDHANEFTAEWIARVVWESFEGTAWDAELPERPSDA